MVSFFLVDEAAVMVG